MTIQMKKMDPRVNVKEAIRYESCLAFWDQELTLDRALRLYHHRVDGEGGKLIHPIRRALEPLLATHHHYKNLRNRRLDH